MSFSRGVASAILCLGYKAQQVMDYFDRSEYKGRVEYVVEKEALGTGGAVKLAKEATLSHDCDDFFLTYADTVMPTLDLRKMFELHEKEKAVVTAVIKELEDTTEFDVVTMSGARITGYVNKPLPKDAPTHLVNVGGYVVNKKIFDLLPGQKAFSWERDVMHEMPSKTRVCGYMYYGEFFQIDSAEKYENTKKKFVQKSSSR